MADATNLSDDALKDVAYLTRSRNRVRILDAVASDSLPPGELAESTGTSRSTLQRILSELEERDWVRRTGGGSYEATSTGDHVLNVLVPFVGSIEAIDELGEAVAALPADSLSIDIHHLRGAKVIHPEPNDPNAPGTFFTTAIRDTEQLRCVVDIAAPLSLEEAMRDNVADDVLQSEHVLTDRLIRYNRGLPERAQTWAELAQFGAEVYRYDGDIPCNVFVLDETVLLGETPPEGEGCVLIETDSEAVLTWAHEFVDEYRAKADRITAESFTDEQPLSADRAP